MLGAGDYLHDTADFQLDPPLDDAHTDPDKRELSPAQALALPAGRLSTHSLHSGSGLRLLTAAARLRSWAG